MSVKPWILGLSTGYHNSAACLFYGDEFKVAIQEERLTRKKRDQMAKDRPSLAVAYCLNAASITLRDVALVVDCPLTPFRKEQSLETILDADDRVPEILRIPHHLGHAVSAFCTSGFKEAAVLVIDGGGSVGGQLLAEERRVAFSCSQMNREHISIYRACEDGIFPVEKHMSDMKYQRPSESQRMPQFRSLGHMFSSVAFQIFGDYMEAGKVMALAPFGKAGIPCEDFFELHGKEFLFKDMVPAMFADAGVWPNHKRDYENLAASVQAALEAALRNLISRIRENVIGQNLCYAGGVALNSVANYNILRNAGFDGIHIIPASEDSGTAIGAACFGWKTLRGKYTSRQMRSDEGGRSYSAQEVNAAVAQMPGVTSVKSTNVFAETAALLCEGKIVGWFQGRSEFGPRALGHRSILCDPRNPHAVDILNRRVKHRESFRPFAPAILSQSVAEWFQISRASEPTNFMLEVCPFLSEAAKKVPAVVHVDGTGRLQTLDEMNSPSFYKLVSAFRDRTGIPIVLNTSMNIMGEPIVETPTEALWLLLFTELDCCVIEDVIVTKDETFRSVLDFIPHLTAKGLSMKDNEPRTDGHRVPERDNKTTQRIREVLQRIDDRSTFRTILPGDSSASGPDDLDMRIVGELFRNSLVRFDKLESNAQLVASLHY